MLSFTSLQQLFLLTLALHTYAAPLRQAFHTRDLTSPGGSDALARRGNGPSRPEMDDSSSISELTQPGSSMHRPTFEEARPSIDAQVASTQGKPKKKPWWKKIFSKKSDKSSGKKSTPSVRAAPISRAKVRVVNAAKPATGRRSAVQPQKIGKPGQKRLATKKGPVSAQPGKKPNPRPGMKPVVARGKAQSVGKSVPKAAPKKNGPKRA
ncbi:hypothetical protein DFP72DRAFT_887647 [Ephemerocybe angulata]|uniref:Uncharacterized protein n=1 Tax=Ephemerocybe angulata TaxID=980116 RepID=A0A8H6MB21_9AGAR|nr:hypothetical protein DFP72DRAFT_189062 [Tulosesus angulatus]KAF6758601.1 hypothetical protein DFP72DRAFT_887647 [Tulosesus angulatus]